MPALKKNLDSSEVLIPARIVIGVTGHRQFEDEEAVAEKIREVISRIVDMSPPMDHTPVVCSLLSPLAEGADRLVAREILELPDSQLEVFLPLDKEDYVQDFSTPESRAEFDRLTSQATRVSKLRSDAGRPEAYKQVGQFIVDHCSVLIAIWDGNPAKGTGGTAEIVQYAREKNRPLLWIHTGEENQITFEPGQGFDLSLYKDLDRYNAEKIDVREIERQAEQMGDDLLAKADKHGIARNEIQEIHEKLLPHFVRSDLLAMRYQNLHLRTGSMVYLLAAAAVAVIAFQTIFLPKWPAILVLEVLFMIAVLSIIYLGHRQHWHEKWIDYRFLAERFRSALFLLTIDFEMPVLSPSGYLSVHYAPRDWMLLAFSNVWAQIPDKPDVRIPSSQFQELKKYVNEAWIEDQIDFHEKASKKCVRRNRTLSVTGIVLFGITLAAAVVHIFHPGADWLNRLLSFTAISCPAIAGALGAIRTHREYRRNAKRYKNTAEQLGKSKEKIDKSENSEDLAVAVSEAYELMLNENADWCLIVRQHVPELPA